jgi:hypothetical protein
MHIFSTMDYLIVYTSFYPVEIWHYSQGGQMVNFVVIWTLKLDGSHLYKGIKTKSQVTQKYMSRGQMNVLKGRNNLKSKIHW